MGHQGQVSSQAYVAAMQAIHEEIQKHMNVIGPQACSLHSDRADCEESCFTDGLLQPVGNTYLQEFVLCVTVVDLDTGDAQYASLYPKTMLNTHAIGLMSACLDEM